MWSEIHHFSSIANNAMWEASQTVLVTKFLVVLEPQGIHPKQQMQRNMSTDVEFWLTLCPDTSIVK